jgi:GT2 family glycosyltransferase
MRHMTSLSVLIPVYDDWLEALDLLERTKAQLHTVEKIEFVLIALDPACTSDTHNSQLPQEVTFLSTNSHRGLPKAKNLGLQASSGQLILFLFPGILPGPNAVARLVSQMCRNPGWGGVSGRWNSAQGRVEKGYNLRRYPTLASLLYDLTFINKIFPANRITRRYKMHDFDHNTLCAAEHVNDCAFITRRQLLQELGGFNESYEFGWFDQVEACFKMNRSGHPIYYDPEAVFTSTEREPLVNRMLAHHYTDFYEDESWFVKREFGTSRWRLFRIVLALGMAIRLAFTYFIPRNGRSWQLHRYRSYVDDDYIREMRRAYHAMLMGVLAAEYRKTGAP